MKFPVDDPPLQKSITAYDIGKVLPQELTHPAVQLVTVCATLLSTVGLTIQVQVLVITLAQLISAMHK